MNRTPHLIDSDQAYEKERQGERGNAAKQVEAILASLKEIHRKRPELIEPGRIEQVEKTLTFLNGGEAGD